MSPELKALEVAVAGIDDPWRRLEAACAAHIQMLVDGSPFGAVLSRDMPRTSGRLLATLTTYRDQYENAFKAIFDGLGIEDELRLRRAFAT